MRWLPVELSREWLSNLLTQCETLGIRDKFEVEALAYGHLPLAYSARCFTARSENRSKDDCETCCQKNTLKAGSTLTRKSANLFLMVSKHKAAIVITWVTIKHQ